jgi:CDP-4-dehydro-6-deoxyglucose reductase, E1
MTKEKIFELIKEHMNARKEEFVPGTTKVSVGFPCYGPEEIISAVDSLLDLKLSQGKKVLTFEQDYARYVGTKHGVAVNSGSSANLLALAALIEAGRVKPGAEVIVPSATFTTVISPILQNGLVPVYVDVDPQTYNIMPAAIEAAITPNTGLIMPVHSLGCPADMHAIMEIAKKHKLPVLEDCCEAHSALIGGKMVGSFGTVGTYSFFVAHNMTTGEGGMIMTNDDELDTILRSMREFGRMRNYDPKKPRFSYNDEFLHDYDERYVFERIGYNVRMSDIHASLGIEQLRRLPGLNERRIENVKYYLAELARHKEHLQLPTVPQGGFHSFYGFPILVRKDAPFARAELVRFLESRGIETRAFMGGHLAVQPAYREQPGRMHGALANTELVFNHAFFIGCHPNITDDARTHVVKAFDDFFAQR